MARLSGNDIASYQGDPNYDVLIKNANFLIVKATEGNGFTDPKLRRNQSEARRVGLALGYYAFARPDLGNAPELEANFFLNQIGQLQPGEILVLDYEVSWNGDVVGWCKKWLDQIYAKTGVKPLIYMSESFVIKYDWTPVVTAGYGLWIAKYLNTPNPDYTDFNTGKWQFAAMYQWTSAQTVPGISGRVDGDVFYGDLATFKKYGYKPAAPTPPPAEDPKDKKIAELTSQVTNLTKENEQLKKDKDLLNSKISGAKIALA